MAGIQISQKEKELGLRFKCFQGETFDDACKAKNSWFAKNKGLKIVKLKTRTVRGRGRVVGKWSVFKIYVSYIEAEKFEALKDYRRKYHEEKYAKKRLIAPQQVSQKINKYSRRVYHHERKNYKFNHKTSIRVCKRKDYSITLCG